MTYQQEEERARLGRRLNEEAVNLAIQGRWEEAVAVNRSIIDRFPGDVGAYNRLGRALAELGEFVRAKEAYSKALELAPNNVIAVKNLARLASLPAAKASLDRGHHRVAPELFITEISKAGVVNLCNLAPTEVLARMGIGNQVLLRVEGQSLVVENDQGRYLGEVEPKHGLRLIKLIEGGNRYAAAIHSVREDGVRVIIREEYQHPSQVGCPSFPVKATEHLRPYVKEYLPRRDVIAEEGEEIKEVETVEGETGYSEEEDREKGLPEGFSILEEA
jgi:hypothetical protein